MPKCPRNGAVFTTPSGAKVKVIPLGLTPGGGRSNATCVVEDGETLVRVVRDGRKVLMPMSQLTPTTRVTAPPVMHVDHWRNERYGFTQPAAPGVQGLGGRGPSAPKDQLLREYETLTAQLASVSNRSSDPYAVKQRKIAEDIAAAAIAAGASYSEIAAASRRGRKRGKSGLRGLEETETLKLYGGCVKKCRRHAPQALGPCIDRCQEKGGQVGGTASFHAQNAQAWASNAIEEAEVGAADALDKGQCNRALESLVRAERKTTLASTHATQAGDEALRAKARASNTLVNSLWREFQGKCLRPGDRPSSVLPFEGLGGTGSLHERIAAVLGWSVHDVQGFSLQMLREMVRTKDPRLAQEISDMVQSGGHIYR